jgi:hypothetical protein
MMNSRTGRPFRKLWWGLVLASLTHLCSANTLSYVGSLDADDDTFSASFTLQVDSLLTAQSFSFAGGTNALGQAFGPGGFAPVLSLFQGPSDELLGSAVANAGGHGGHFDALTGFAWDAYLNLSLRAGQYTIVLSQDGNFANGPFLADGFGMTGQTDYTGQAWGNPGGMFILTNSGTVFDGKARSSQWGFDLSAQGLQALPVPEPDGLALMLAGLASLALVQRRRAI